MTHGISVGDHYQFCSGMVRGTFKVESEGSENLLTLINLADGQERRLKAIDLAVLQARGGAVRTRREGEIIRTLTAFDIRSLHEPPKKVLTDSQLMQWEIRRADFQRAATLLFYVRAFDASPGTKKSTDALDELILSKLSDAKAAGLSENAPSASAVRKALKKGSADNRTIALYLRKRGSARKQSKWPAWVYDIGQETVAHYWSNAVVLFKDAHKFFDDKFYAKRGELIAEREKEAGEDDPPEDSADPDRFADLMFEPPCPQTLSNWINEARCHATIKSKFGIRQANRELRGRGESVTAIAPLEILVLDQTLGDVWACEELQIDGTIAIVLKRPWIVWAMDLYSRSIAGLIITFDPPCVATLMACLRETISPKTSLMERFGEAKGATDVYGQWKVVMLDNALAHIGVSLQLVGDIVGFEVDYAPIRTPEYKPWIERLVRTMNGALHALPGGIPYPPEELEIRGIDPRKGAALSAKSIRELMDHKIVEYHLEVHDGIGMAPARKWTEGISEVGRRTVDDARSLKLALGRYETRVLTAEGILLNGHTFHDQGITSMLLDHMARFHRERRKRKPGQTASFRVHLFYDEPDCSSISVIDEFTNEIVELPNSDEFYAEKPVSFAFSKAEREYHANLNKSFHTREEKARARREFTKDLEAKLANDNHSEGKRTIRVLQGRENTELAPGSQIVDVKISPSITGMPKSEIIPTTMPFVERAEVITVPNGRKVSAKKPPKTRKTAAIAEVANDPVSPSTSEPVDTDFDWAAQRDVDESEAALDELARRYGL
ncbi:hypothetical protein G6L29_10660 [Agrobacterium rhizogenes]|uniref:hypothetical protein n=1 Tax=Rhizobium rhizogenes TaxID=359 RepID=UPI0015720F1F|nr:hypothetical protein [Rhizobium rhizogenes]NTI16096.1 hypothetical protein [Rhizobium rhizogenes]